MPTIYDVARRAGVSIATVSAVLNRSAYVSPELTRRVKEAVKELDYTINHLAHSLQTRSTHTVGMLIPDVATPDPFFGQVIRGAEDVLRKKGYLLILGHTYNQVEEQSRYLAAFRSRLVDGVLLFQAPGEDDELRRLIETRRPVVFVGRVPKDLQADVVATDIAAGTRMGVEHLLDRGHTLIGLVAVAKSMSVAEYRAGAWRAALEARGLTASQTLLATTDLTVEGAHAAALRLLDADPRPTALFLDNLLITTGVLKAMAERGLRCPQDVELVSSDDADWLDVFQPPISTIVQPAYELGAQAAEVLLKRIRHPKRQHRTELLTPRLRVRP